MNQPGGSETESNEDDQSRVQIHSKHVNDGNPDDLRAVNEELRQRIQDLERSEREMIRLAAESERQRRVYETVLTNTPDFIYVFGLDHKVIYANESLIEMWGNGYEGAIGKTLLEIGYEPWEAEMHNREIDHVRETGETVRGEVPFKGTQGPRIYDYIFAPIYGSDGKVEAVAGTTRDVTERKKVEQQLEEGRQQLDFALAGADLGHWSLNLSDHTAHRTLRHDQIFGYDKLLPEWTYEMFLDHVLPEDRQEVDAAFQNAVASGTIWAIECRIRRADGAKSYIWTKGIVQRNDEGQPKSMLGIICDNTDRRVLEEQQAFLIQLSDVLRPLSDPIVVQAEASRLLGEWLGADRVAYFEVSGGEYVVERDYTNGALSLVGRYQLTSFGPELLANFRYGRTVCEFDVEDHPSRTPGEKMAFAALHARAILGVPLVKEGDFVAGLEVNSSSPRNWTPTEILTVEQTAERTWAAVERARAEAKLAKSEERSAFVRHSSGIGFWYCDLPFDLLQWDDIVKEHFYLPPDATVTIEKFYELIHPDDREATRLAIGRSISEGSHYDVVYRTVPAGADTNKYIRAIGRTFYAEDGTPVSFDGITLDVTEQKRSEANLRESEKRFRLVADAAPVLIWVSGTDKLVNWLNQPWLQFTGRSLEDEIGDGWVQSVYPPDRPRLLQGYFEAFDARLPFSLEYRLRRHDGQYRWVVDNGVPRFGVDGEFQGYIGSCLDVTDYKNVESAMRDADRRKDEFLATLAHELRNPLAPIGSGLEIMRMANYAPGPVAKTSIMMERQLKQMVRLIDDLMDVSRINSGKLVLQKEPVSLATVVENAVETSRPLIQQMDHELTIQLPESPVILNVDLTRLAQVFSNLLNNAAKYTEQGGQIWLTAHQVGNEIIVSVKDSGIGIEKEDLPRLFEMFSQVNTSLGKAQGGLGIGLMLVKRLLEMHGGSIEAHSDGHGMGSEFVVQLPLVAEPVFIAESEDGERNGSRSSLRILVVDDNEDIAYTLSSLLEIKGYQTQVAYSGEEALMVAAEFNPELVMLDIGLPQIDGYETCRRLRQLPGGGEMTIIAQSGWGGPEDRRRSEAAGFDHHLVKPFIMDQLSKVLESLRST